MKLDIYPNCLTLPLNFLSQFSIECFSLEDVQQFRVCPTWVWSRLIIYLPGAPPVEKQHSFWKFLAGIIVPFVREKKIEISTGLC